MKKLLVLGALMCSLSAFAQSKKITFYKLVLREWGSVLARREAAHRRTR